MTIYEQKVARPVHHCRRCGNGDLPAKGALCARCAEKLAAGVSAMTHHNPLYART